MDVDLDDAPAGSGVLAVDHELVGAESRLARVFARGLTEPSGYVLAEAGDLGPKRNGAVVFVVRQVVDGGSNGHGRARAS